MYILYVRGDRPRQCFLFLVFRLDFNSTLSTISISSSYSTLRRCFDSKAKPSGVSNSDGESLFDISLAVIEVIWGTVQRLLLFLDIDDFLRDFMCRLSLVCS